MAMRGSEMGLCHALTIVLLFVLFVNVDLISLYLSQW